MSAGIAGLVDRVALVTGASRGIGAAIAYRLSDDGAVVAVNYRREAGRAEEVRTRLRHGSTAWRADIADEAAAAQLVEDVLAHHGRLDVLVANAGVWHGGRIEQIDPADWRSVLETSLVGSFNLCRAAVPAMRAAGFGRIVVISSVMGMIGFAGDTAYAAAKAGQLGFVKALAKEVARDGITVNAVAPGYISTDMTAGIGEQETELLLRRTPLRRPGRAEDVAAAVSYLCCDADYVTGHTLVVDGGMSL